ncbi:7998_t:CDS:10 [Funneliformis caledonium]|uniref:7998_t:CDS:1 n=1 Tax=Funneliformis caledonium TaxID=1117310 RepID=A0A9N8YPG4_9GLOM|nr:7998_t:CDS:10 [Funneliformis caledonium]
MKFEKHLQTEIAPEWRVKYIDYKALKKSLKTVYNAKIAREKEEKELMQSKFNTAGSSVFVEVPPQSYRNYKFGNYNENEIDVKKFPKNKEKLFPANHERGFSANNDKSKRNSIQSRTFTMNSLSDSVHDFFHKVSSALVTAQKSNSHQLSTPTHISSLETLMFEVEPEERLFFKAVDQELEKVDHFYETKEKDMLKHFDLLVQQYEILKSKKQKNVHADAWKTSKSIVKQSFDYFGPEIVSRRGSTVDEQFDYRTAKKRIKNAVFEYYRGVELLKNFAHLNYTGFAKILKKYDKITERNGSKIYMPKVESFRFVKSNVTSKVLKDVEDFYVKHFEDGSNAQAIRKLRIPNNKHLTYYSSVLRVGLCLGLSIPFLIYSLVKARNKHSFDKSDSDMEDDELVSKIDLELYAAIALPLILLLLIGVNMYTWIRFRINYKFIFELNPRNNLDYRQYLELPSIAFLSLSFIMLLGYTIHYEFRRWQWNFFRVEYEHISNCEQCRAIKDVPLPFPIQTKNDDNDIILAPEIIVPENNNDNGVSFASIKNLFRRRMRKNSNSSRSSRHSNPAYNWKDFEANRNTMDYIYADEIYEVSDEGDNVYFREEDSYASRRLPPISDYQYKGKQKSTEI